MFPVRSRTWSWITTIISETSDWHRIGKGIITGCTISVILFAPAMNMVVKSAEVECRGPLTKSGVRKPPIRAYMDDLTITTTSVPGSRWILQGLEKLITWARMSFKPSKSRSMVLKKGKVIEKFSFFISGTVIPTITEQPVKSLGKLFLTPAWKTLPPSRSPTKNLELGSPRLTSLVCLVDLKPGSTSIPSCPESCGPCWSMQSQWQQLSP